MVGFRPGNKRSDTIIRIQTYNDINDPSGLHSHPSTHKSASFFYG
jgi:hypothetical protein